MQIEVAYANQSRQALITVDVAMGATVAAAIQASGILAQFPEIDLEQAKVGIFSKACDLQHSLRDGDRIEIYRPLLIDPKQKRRLRAKS